MAKEFVFSVQTAQAWIDGNVLHVVAQGSTRTGGWTDPELVLSVGENTFDFVAEPPTLPSTSAITPIEAKYRSGPLEPPFPREVVVRAETNEITAPIGAQPVAPPPPDPGPYASA